MATKNKRDINIKDVAEKANVSIATVSNVINKKGRVSKKTIEKVEKVIDELGYIPSISARNLKTRKSHLIGVVVPTMSPGRLQDNPFYWDLVSGIEEGARDNRFHVILLGIDESDDDLSFIRKRQLDGLIVVGGHDDSTTIQQILTLDIPCVFMDSYLSDPEIYQVCIDDRSGAYQATKHLLELGHETIAVLLGDIKLDEIMKYGVLHERLLGYKSALFEKGIAYEKDLILQYPTSMEGGYQAAKKLAKKEKITAVFSFSDVSAMGLLRGFHELGIRVPDDISVIGFDDVFISEYTIPPLTTVRQDIVEKGQMAVNLLLDQLEETNKYSYRKVILPVNLKIRNTTQRVKQK